MCRYTYLFWSVEPLQQQSNCRAKKIIWMPIWNPIYQLHTSPWKFNLSFLLRGDRGIPEIHAIQEKREKWELEFETQKRVSWTLRWSKLDFLNMKTHIPGPEISNVIQKQQKIQKYVSMFSKNSKILYKGYMKSYPPQR